MRYAVVDGAPRGHERLGGEQTAEHAALAPSGLPEETVLGERIEIEPPQQLRERRPAHVPASRKAGMTCSPNNSIERMTLSGGMRYGFIRQRSWSHPAAR